MKKSLKVLVSLLPLTLLACTNNEEKKSSSTIDYGSNYDMANEYADQSYLYGMTDLSWSEYSWTSIDWKETHKLISKMGVKSVRVWLHSYWIMKDPETYSEKGLALGREIVESLLDMDVQIIGMNHSNFHSESHVNGKSTVAKPARDLSEGSEYLLWLEDYKTTWKNLVKAFPEIIYWEIDNEDNNDVFFENLDGGSFTLREKADIYTDMLYYASLGIHEGNPNAITVLGGLITKSAENFLQYIYDNIASGDFYSTYPDDFFQVACWHPYMDNFSETGFKKINDDIYAVIKKNEGKDKKVFLTEMGWSEGNISAENIADYIPRMYKLIKEEMPYVESVHYFRMYDDLSSTWGSASEKTFGLFTDPRNHGVANENEILAAPKDSAYVYQKSAGGSGSLTSYQEKVNSGSSEA